MEEDIKNSFNRIETIMNNEVCEFNKTIIEGNLNVIKRYIENLIKGYKELEEENIKLHTEIAEVVYWESSSVEQIKQDYIPKSELREKIEKLLEHKENINEKFDKAFYNLTDIIEFEIKVLEELLQEGDK